MKNPHWLDALLSVLSLSSDSANEGVDAEAKAILDTEERNTGDICSYTAEYRDFLCDLMEDNQVTLAMQCREPWTTFSSLRKAVLCNRYYIKCHRKVFPLKPWLLASFGALSCIQYYSCDNTFLCSKFSPPYMGMWRETKGTFEKIMDST